MKRILFAIVFIFFIPSMLFADEADKGLPSDTPLRVKESARQTIQVGVQSAEVIKMTKFMLAGNFSEQQIIASHELLIKASKQDLSVEPIINKLYEGMAKNVGADNVLQAMEKVRARYELAKTYAQNWKADDAQTRIMTNEAAECMAAGIDKNSMNKMMEMLQAKTKSASRNEAFELNEKTLFTARTMARSGVNSNDIVDVVSNAFRRNYNAGEIQKLGSTFMTQAKGMSSASDLAKAYSRAIKNGATADNIGSLNALAPLSSGSIMVGAAPPGGGPPGGMPPGGGTPPPSGAAPPVSGARPSPAGISGPAAPPSGVPQGPAPGAPPK